MVVISNGFQKFHLAWAAAEAHKRGQLSLFITGAYPTAMLKRLATSTGLARNRRFDRLLGREEPIPDSLIASNWFAESLYQLGSRMDSFPLLAPTGVRLTAASMRVYGSTATAHVIKAAAGGAKIYHYRSGFGHDSVSTAKRMGMIALCDYSIAHAALLEQLIANDGRMGPPLSRGRLSPVWRAVLEDVELSDAVLVNSDFVRDTFIHQGWSSERIYVIYQGIDDSFLRLADTLHPDRQRRSVEFQLLFPGSIFDKRKGAHILIAALEQLPPTSWKLEIAGGIARDVANRYSDFLSDERVTHLGTLSRQDLAQAFMKTDVVVLPSLAEGSARVIFEALACGRYVITTPNSGSVIGLIGGGAIVPPGDPLALATAIRNAMDNRSALDEVGRQAKARVRADYPQKSYGDALCSLYRQLLTTNAHLRAA